MKQILALIGLGMVCWMGWIPAIAAPAKKQPVKIGAILPLSGNAAAFGEEARRALTLALEDVSDGSFRGELVFEDDQMNPAKTAVAAQKLLRVDQVDALISFGSPAGNVVAPLAEEAKVVHVGLASDPNVARGRFNFIHWTPPATEVKLFIEELKRRKIESLAIFELNQPGILSITNDLVEQLEGAGVKLVARHRFNPGERDFRSTLAKTKALKPQLILLEALSPELELVRRQIREAGVQSQITGIETLDLTETPSLFNGCWYVSSADAPQGLKGRMQGRFGQKRFFVSGYAYDVLHILAAAYDKAGALQPGAGRNDAVVRWLMNLHDYPAPSGRISIDRDGIVQSEATVKVMRDGKAVVVP